MGGLMKKLLILSMLILFSAFAMADTKTSFNDSLTIQNLTYSSAPQNFTYYLNIPQGSTINQAYLNLSGFNFYPTFYDNFADGIYAPSIYINKSVAGANVPVVEGVGSLTITATNGDGTRGLVFINRSMNNSIITFKVASASAVLNSAMFSFFIQNSTNCTISISDAYCDAVSRIDDWIGRNSGNNVSTGDIVQYKYNGSLYRQKNYGGWINITDAYGTYWSGLTDQYAGFYVDGTWQGADTYIGISWVNISNPNPVFPSNIAIYVNDSTIYQNLTEFNSTNQNTRAMLNVTPITNCLIGSTPCSFFFESQSNGILQLSDIYFDYTAPITNYAPNITIINLPLNNSNYTTRSMEFNYTADDIDNDTLQFILYVNGIYNSTQLERNITFNLSTDGTYYLEILTTDGIANASANSTRVYFTIQSTTAPQLTNVGYVQQTISSLLISFTTNQNTNLTVNYGTTTSLGTILYNNTFATGSQSYIIPVSQGTLYYVNFTVCNINNLCTSSDQYSFTSLSSTSGGGNTPVYSPPAPIITTSYCGNNVCNAGETSDTCPQDCQVIPVQATPQLPFTTPTETISVGNVNLELNINKIMELGKVQSIIIKTLQNGTPVSVNSITFTVYSGNEQVFILSNFIELKTGEYSASFNLQDIPIGKYVAQFKIEKDGVTSASDSLVINIVEQKKSFFTQTIDFFKNIFKSIQGYLIMQNVKIGLNKTQNLNTTQ